jgi:amidohydrolase
MTQRNAPRLLAVLPLLAVLRPGPAGAEDGVAARDGEVAAAAGALREKLVARRRDIHQHPELSNREERTARIVAEDLRALGIQAVKTGVARHGVVAVIEGALPGPVVAIRADMDALPIEEGREVPYRSRNRGVMHACGHDVHTTVQLGVAEVLMKLRGRLRGSVKLIFQPAEEGPPDGEEGGAGLMVKEGVLDAPRPRAIFGLHVAPDVEVGKIAFASGPAMASSDRFIATVEGKMSHGAWPEEGIDAVVVAAECITALQTIRSRRIDTREPVVVTVGKVNGGNRHNIIAPEVTLDGTVRALDESVRLRVKDLLKGILERTASAHGAKVKLDYRDGNPITFNDPPLVEETLPSIRRVMGDANVVTRRPVMGAEDFAAYQKVIPGFYYWLGVRNESKGISAMVHTPAFDVDEECLVIGVKVMATVVLDHLDRHAGERR